MTKVLSTLAAVAGLLATAPSVHAQPNDLPAIPSMIRIVVPYSPGAGTDILARRLANALAPRLKATVIVDNRPGASGIIGTSAVVRGPKDGSQFVFGSVSLVSAAALMSNTSFNLLTDLTPVAVTGEGPLLIAVPANSSIKTPQDLVTAARTKADGISHGTAGVGTIAHVAAELLNSQAKIQIRHIPYKGAAPAVTDTIGGTLDVIFAARTTIAGQLRSGQLRAVAVTSAKPSPAFPKIPTMGSVVPGYSATLYNVLLAPTGTPAALIKRINKEVNEISNSKEMLDLLDADGFTPVNETPEQCAKRIRDSFTAFNRVGTEQHIVLQ